MSVIIIAGRICSGKSHIAGLICAEFGFPIASFGSYLKYYCSQNNLAIDRKTLQDTGEALVRANPHHFLIDMISYFDFPSKTIIIDGVRHRTIFEELKQMMDRYLGIFVDSDVETRYSRYLNRTKILDDLKTRDQFLFIDNHQVEEEIDSLKSHCDLVINSNHQDTIFILSEIRKFIYEKSLL